MVFDFNRSIVNDTVIEKINIFRIADREAKELKKRLEDDLEKGYKKIIIDLSEVEFVNSTFLGVMVVFLKRMNEIEAELKIVIPKQPAESYFYSTGLNRVFNLYRTGEEALDGFDLQ